MDSYHKYVQNETRYIVFKMGENRAGYAFKFKLKESFIVFLWNFKVIFFKKMLAVLNHLLSSYDSLVAFATSICWSRWFARLSSIGDNETLAINCELSLAATRLLSSYSSSTNYHCCHHYSPPPELLLLLRIFNTTKC